MNATELELQVIGGAPIQFAAAPTLGLSLRVRARAGIPVLGIWLSTQVRIEPFSRPYSPGEAQALEALFGSQSRPGQGNGALSWATLATRIGRFDQETTIELELPCPLELHLALTRYVDAIETGVIPLRLFFSGTILESEPDGTPSLRAIPWSREADFALPLSTYRATIEHYFPGRVYLPIARDCFRSLDRYRRDHGIATWEETLTRLAAIGEARTAGRPHSAQGDTGSME